MRVSRGGAASARDSASVVAQKASKSAGSATVGR